MKKKVLEFVDSRGDPRMGETLGLQYFKAPAAVSGKSLLAEAIARAQRKAAWFAKQGR